MTVSSTPLEAARRQSHTTMSRTTVRRSPAYSRARRFSPHLVVGASLVCLLFLAALFAPWITRNPPDVLQPQFRLQAPSWQMPFGADHLGRDLFSRVLFGSRIALQLSIFSVFLAVLPGVFLGLIAGYRSGWVDQSLSRLMDAWLALPGMLLAIVLVARLGPSLQTTILALGVMGVPSFYRIVRAGTLSAKKREYVEAAQSLGAGEGRVLFRHILPNITSPIIVLMTIRLGSTLLMGAGLSFIGLGAQPPQPEWGALLADGRNYLDSAWWLAFFPGMALTLSVLGFNLLGDGLRDVFARH